MLLHNNLIIFFVVVLIVILLDLLGNHNKICIHAGYTDIRTYNYYDDQNRCINFSKMMDDFEVCVHYKSKENINT